MSKGKKVPEPVVHTLEEPIISEEPQFIRTGRWLNLSEVNYIKFCELPDNPDEYFRFILI